MVKNKYNVGDVVQLKSGGPKMTISSVPRGVKDPTDPYDKGQKDYYCEWFKGGTHTGGYFKEELLISIEQETEKPTKGK